MQGEISLLSSCTQEDFLVRSMALELEQRKETPDLDFIQELHCWGVNITRFGRSLTIYLFNQLFREENPSTPPLMPTEKQGSLPISRTLNKKRQLDLLRQWMTSLGLREEASRLDWKTWLTRVNLLQINQQQVLFLYVYSLSRNFVQSTHLNPIAEVQVSKMKSITVDIDGKKGLIHVGKISPLPSTAFIPFFAYGSSFIRRVTSRSFFTTKTKIVFFRKITDRATNEWLPTTYIQCFTPQGGLLPNFWPFSVLKDLYHEVSIEVGAAMWTKAVEECQDLRVAVLSEGLVDLLPEIVKHSTIGYALHLCVMGDGKTRVAGVRIPCRVELKGIKGR